MADHLLLLMSLSLSGSLMAVTVAFFRTLLKKRTPRAFWYYLWLLALLRFLCPLGTQQSLSDRLMERPAELWVTVSEAEEGRPVPEKEGAITIAGEGDKSETKFWPYVLAALWGLGAITALAARYFGCRRLRQELDRTAYPADEWEQAVYRQLAGRRKDVPLLLRTGGVESPVLIGLFRPIIYLPEEKLERRALLYALSHELVHWRRRDLAYKHLVVLVTSLYWFDPVVWLMARAIDRDSELSCDQEVVKNMSLHQRTNYGRTLLWAAERQGRGVRPLSAPFGSQKNCLRERIEAIMKVRKTSKLTKAALWVVTAAAAISFVVVGAYAGGERTSSAAEPTVVQGPVPSEEVSVPAELSWPFEGGQEVKISALFEGRVHPITGKRSEHMGIDFVLEKETPVLAAAQGTVTEVGYNTEYGNYVELSHGGGLSTKYAHLVSGDFCQEGNQVTAGQQIGAVGKTGKSTGYHLHFETMLDGVWVDPMDYFPEARVTNGAA